MSFDFFVVHYIHCNLFLKVLLLTHHLFDLIVSRFTVPFEEDDKDPSIWFLDHNYHESMFHMFKRINGISEEK